MEKYLPYKYKTFTGVVLNDQVVDLYNQLTKTINQYLEQGRTPPENLLNGRHNLFNSAAMTKGTRIKCYYKRWWSKR